MKRMILVNEAKGVSTRSFLDLVGEAPELPFDLRVRAGHRVLRFEGKQGRRWESYRLSGA